MQWCIDTTLGFSALLSNHVEQNLGLMLISYSLLLIIHFCLGRLTLQLRARQVWLERANSVSVCVCVFGGGWVTFSLLHVLTYKAKTYFSKTGAYVCIIAKIMYKYLQIVMCVCGCVWAVFPYSLISLMSFRHV